MIYIFTGFRQVNSVRQFGFDCVAEDRSRTQVTVGADLALARKHFILLQDLPLLCRRLLETSDGSALTDSLTLTEDNMLAVETAIRNAKAEKKPSRKPIASNKLGQAWRSPEAPVIN
jgi:hypothetical protein